MNDKTVSAQMEALKAKAEQAGHKTKAMIQLETILLAVEDRIGHLREATLLPASTLTAEENPHGYTREQLEVVAAVEIVQRLHNLADVIRGTTQVTGLTLALEAEMYRPGKKGLDG